MRLAASNDLRSQIVSLASAGVDPLGIEPSDISSDDSETAWKMRVDDARRAGAVVDEELCGATDDAARRVADRLRRMLDAGRMAQPVRRDPLSPKPIACIPLDATTAALLAHVGVDPLVAAWMTAEQGQAEIRDPFDQSVVARIDGYRKPKSSECGTFVHVGGEVCWGSSGRVSMPGVPHAVAAALVGRLLREVVSHPILDRIDAVVVHAETFDGLAPITSPITKLRVRAPVRTATIRDLMRLGAPLRERRAEIEAEREAARRSRIDVWPAAGGQNGGKHPDYAET